MNSGVGSWGELNREVVGQGGSPLKAWLGLEDLFSKWQFHMVDKWVLRVGGRT